MSSVPLVKERTVQMDCKVVSISYQDMDIDLKEKVRLYLEPDSTKCCREIGDSVFFIGRLNEIRNPCNPGEFNYARYLRNLGIHYSAFVGKTDYYFGNYSGKMKIRRFSSRLQRQLIELFSKYNIRDDELGVLSALTAGNRNYLEQEVTENYIAIGAMHILSVSGLHVGILYLILNSLFRNWSSSGYYRMFRTVVILAAIWLYAFITGLSSSVLRAAVMFSLFILGKNLQRRANSYSVIAASALLILLINPAELCKVGFQFSYLAVLGIIYFQPKLEQLFIIRNTIVDRIWQLFTVSIAAQLTTFPLSLYYFHQFPIYFWFANILIIPLVWLIMIGAVIFCFLIPISFLLPYLAFGLNILLRLLNQSVEFIGRLPFATITDIRFEAFDLVVCAMAIVLLILLIYFKRYKLIPFLSGLLFVLLILASIVSFNRTSWRKEFIVYSTRSDVLIISLIDGNNHTVITKGVQAFEEDNTIKYLKNFWVSRNIKRGLNWIPVDNQVPGKKFLGPNLKIQFEPFGFVGEFYTIGFLYTKRTRQNNLPDPMCYKGKFLIIDNNSGYPGNYPSEQCTPKQILTVNFLSSYKREIWKNYASKNGIALYDISTNGAFQKIQSSYIDKSGQKRE